MMRRRIVFVALLLAVAAMGTTVAASDKDKPAAPAGPGATVHFGQHPMQTPEPQPPAGNGAGGAVTHFLFPDDVTILKGGTVTFVVNGGGHGIAIHSVSKKTTRADIAEDLCDGNNHETGTGNEIADRRARFLVCNNAV